MDSRDQGRSGESPDKIDYEKITDDLAALLDHLKSGPVYVLGWSDGGIEALLLGIHHPAKVKKIAAMAANLNPQGLYPAISDWARNEINSMPPEAKPTSSFPFGCKYHSQPAMESPHHSEEVAEQAYGGGFRRPFGAHIRIVHQLRHRLPA